MSERQPVRPKRSRREVFALAGAAAATLAAPAIVRAQTRRSKPNMIFVFTDQERYPRQWPQGVALPAHERLARTGVTFHNHYGSASMCTSARSVMLTGLQTVDTRMFDNTDTPWVSAMSTKLPNIGNMLRKAGYYTAYKGKWHLNELFDSFDNRLFTKEMEEYGFADYNGIGDIIGHTLGGYQFDPLIAGSAVTWLRRHGRPLSDEGKPWFLVVSLVNPHDIMYFNADPPGQNVQDTGKLMMHAARAPNHDFYRANWNPAVPATLREPLDAPGRPAAHGEFVKMWSHVLGSIPLDDDRWRRFNNYYVNCIRAVDSQVARILAELDALKLTDNTAIMYTSDHGEMAGAHGLRGKGPCAYEETMHLPFYVKHPDVKGGQSSRALTSHIDIVPTLLAMAGVDGTKRAELAGRALPGKDISPALAAPAATGVNALRDAALFTFSGLSTVDSEIWRLVAAAKAEKKDPKEELKRQGFRPNLKKRGTVRAIFDGRYKYGRYFGPVEHNTPTSLDDLYKNNDVELYDLKTDPAETRNLARDRVKNAALVTQMNGKLNAAIKTEMGADDGRELPEIPKITWTINRVDL
jgi:arylsulfatase